MTYMIRNTHARFDNHYFAGWHPDADDVEYVYWWAPGDLTPKHPPVTFETREEAQAVADGIPRMYEDWGGCIGLAQLIVDEITGSYAWILGGSASIGIYINVENGGVGWGVYRSGNFTVGAQIGASGSVTGSYNTGGLENFTGPSVGSGAGVAVGPGVNYDYSRSLWGAGETAPGTHSVSLGLGGEADLAHGSVGYTSVGVAMRAGPTPEIPRGSPRHPDHNPDPGRGLSAPPRQPARSMDASVARTSSPAAASSPGDMSQTESNYSPSDACDIMSCLDE